MLNLFLKKYVENIILTLLGNEIAVVGSTKTNLILEFVKCSEVLSVLCFSIVIIHILILVWAEAQVSFKVLLKHYRSL